MTFGPRLAGKSRPTRRRDPRVRRPGMALLAAASCSLAPDAYAQLAGGGLSDTSLGSGARSVVESVLGGPPRVSLGIPFTFSGDIGVDIGASDGYGSGGFNGGGSGNGIQFFGILSPDLYLNGAGNRLTASLAYSPRLTYYPSSSQQTILSQNFNGSATYAVVPDFLFFNVRGYTGVSSRFGDTSLLSNTFYSRNDAIQTSSFSASPYIIKTFGGIGTLTAGYVYSRTFSDDYGSFNPGLYSPLYTTAPNAAATAGYGAVGDLSTNTEYATFTTGEDLGRIQDSISATASQNGGSDFYGGSSTYSITNTLSYALNRTVTLLGTIGYEDYRYPRGNYSFNDIIWLVGATVTPNADSSITVQYGQTAGTNTVLANGSYAPTAKTRIYGSYTVGIQTGLGARQGLLSSTTVGPGGILIDRATGGPVIANGYLASQYPLSRVKSLNVGAALLLDRDSFSLNFGYTSTNQLVTSTDVLGVTTGAGTTTNTKTVSLGWQHELSPSTSLYSAISYYDSDNGVYFGNPGGSSETIQLYAGLNHTFTETLTGHVTFSHVERIGGATQNLPSFYGGNASQNALLVGIRKSF